MRDVAWQLFQLPMIVCRVLILSIYCTECGKSLLYFYNQTLDFFMPLVFLYVILYFACTFSIIDDQFTTRIGSHVVANNRVDIHINMWR